MWIRFFAVKINKTSTKLKQNQDKRHRNEVVCKREIIDMTAGLRMCSLMIYECVCRWEAKFEFIHAARPKMNA